MSKKKKPIEGERPSFKEFIGRKLVDSAMHKKHKNLKPQEHNHDHDHPSYTFVAMVVGRVIKEVVQVEDRVKTILLDQPVMVELKESEYPVRPTIGWQLVEGVFLPPEENK